MSWICVPDTEGSLLPSNSSEIPSGLYATSNGTPSVRPSSWPGWKKRPWIRLLCGTMLPPLMADAGVEKWISSRLDSHASLSATQENGGV
jgi:hypothetical protein